ncbi:hypothetical protein OXYTRIMIC_272 [Oxytricha trifallax]|uniref:Uncharacterized protein n=1 Tax=Oxytricha trifallax TaxID=1172189 RepID=A0A073ICP9_9SPIT|nr:hypothetical protein OXYTRIMIC_272 [Oxytricha trifallax]
MLQKVIDAAKERIAIVQLFSKGLISLEKYNEESGVSVQEIKNDMQKIEDLQLELIIARKMNEIEKKSREAEIELYIEEEKKQLD